VKRAGLPTAAFRAFHVLPSQHTARGHWPAASLAVHCLPACLPAVPAGMRGALWFSWGLHWRCIMRFTYSSGHVVLFGRATLAGLGVGAKPGRPAVGSECSSRFGCHAHAVRTVGRSLMGCSLLEHSLPACQPASLQACQQLPAWFWNTKLAELNSKARLHRARLGVGHNAPASMLALSPFSCSD
jgi:hypothetical protein